MISSTRRWKALPLLALNQGQVCTCPSRAMVQVMADASPGAYRFALFILSPQGQRILASYGFSAPNLP
jgi:hypothetical protein